MPANEFRKLAENVRKLKSNVANADRWLAKVAVHLGRAANVTPVPPPPPRRGKDLRKLHGYIANVDRWLAKVAVHLGRAANVTPTPPGPPKRGKVTVANLARRG